MAKKSQVPELPPLALLRKLKPATDNQSDYFYSIENNPITLCYGPAGTGKSAIAVFKAAQALSQGRVKNIILSRPMVQTGNGLGFLPGSELEKFMPFMTPLIDELDSIFGPATVRMLIEQGVIKLSPLELMRGRNHHNCFTVLDEAQNCDMSQIKLFLSRLGQNSRAVVCGDTRQTDLAEKSGFMECVNRLEPSEFVGVCELDYNDIQRSGILKDVLGRLED